MGRLAGSKKRIRNIAYSPLPVAATVSSVDGAVQRLFGIDRVGQKRGALSRSDQADISESGTYRIDRRADISDVAGCDTRGTD